LGRSLPPGECSSLIVLTGSLGDVARGLPLAGVLKTAGPAVRVSWVVERRWASLVSLCRHVDRIIEFDRAGGGRALLQLLGALRAERYHVALDLQRLFKSGLLARWSGAPRRVGFHPRDSRELNRFFNTEYIAAHGNGVSKLRHYFAFAEHLGLERPARPDFGIDAAALAAHWPAALGESTPPYVVVAMGTSWPSKNWPPAEAARFCERILSGTPFSIVLVGNGRTAAANGGSGIDRDPVDLAGGGRLVDLRGQTTLPQLAALLAHARLAVGPDTGTGHVAAAVGAPYLGLFGPTDPRRVAPWGSEALAITSPAPCTGCRRRTCATTPDWCMAAITADLVWQRAREVLDVEPHAEAGPRTRAAAAPPRRV
jgi:ADP-heptose:LPS heptosyltransferase